jgi:hypothetical protein
MILAEDLATMRSVALRLADIEELAALPDDFIAPEVDDDDDDHAASQQSRPWRPGHGERPLAGHVACPCGSGERYRVCCRRSPTAYRSSRRSAPTRDYITRQTLNIAAVSQVKPVGHSFAAPHAISHATANV